MKYSETILAFISGHKWVLKPETRICRRRLDAINIHFITEEGYSILAETSILRFFKSVTTILRFLLLCLTTTTVCRRPCSID